MPTTLLIDGDPIAFNAALYDDGRGPGPGVAALDKVLKLKQQLRADRAIVALSDASRRYFRHDLDDAYKSNRKPPPANIAQARAGFACRERSVFVREIPTLEADDVLGILATDPRVEGRKIIVADDEHLMTIPGEHHRPKTFKYGQTAHVSLAEADVRHLRQTLVAYCDDVGRVGAEKAVGLLAYTQSPADVWQSVVETFEAHGHSGDDALTAARIVRVCRVSEFDFKTNRPVLWMPPGDNYSAQYSRPDAPVPTKPTPASAPVPASMFENDGPRQRWA